MKSKFLLIPALLLGATAAFGGGLALSQNKMSEAKAYSDADSYTATADHFVASFHRNNALRDAYNGDDINNLDSTRADNVVISDMDHTSSISWKVSVGKYSYDTFRNLKMGNSTKTIENHSDQEFADIYSALNIASGHFVSAMYSTTAISNIQDLALTWAAVKGDLHSENQGNIYFLYKKSGGSWTAMYYKLKTDRTYYDGIYGTDDPGSDGSAWNYRRANITTEYVNHSGLLGETAQIAVAYDAGTTSSKNFICLNTLMVNRVASAKATMHYWDKGGNDLELCTYITDKMANNSVKIAMFAKSIEQIQVDGGTYSGVTIDGLDVAANFTYHNAKESTYYNELAYLCQQAGVALNKAPTSSNFMRAAIKNNTALIVSVSVAAAAVLGTSLFFGLRKRKHN